MSRPAHSGCEFRGSRHSDSVPLRNSVSETIVPSFGLPPVAVDEPGRENCDECGSDRYSQVGACVPVFPCTVGLREYEHLITVVALGI
jgi:hypothetical protein